MAAFNKTVSQKLDKLSPGQIQELFSDLAGEHEMFFSVIESVPTGILIVGTDGRLLLHNKAAERLLPFSVRPDEIKSEGLDFWDFILDEEISSFLRGCFEKNNTLVSSDFSVPASGSSSKIRFVTISITPLVTRGELSGSIILVRDITEYRNQEILLHRMETLAGLTNLAAGVAHEIKNPLGAISIHIQLLQKAIDNARKKGDALPEKKFVEDYIDVVNEEIDNLNEIVTSFLFAVRPVNANLELVNPNTVLEKTLDFFAVEFNKKGIEIKRDFCENPARIMLDQKLFREVIVNLAQNSIAALDEKFSEEKFSGEKFTEKKIRLSQKAERPTFSVSTSQKDDKFLIVIKDNGKGMSRQTLERVFEPYYTTKASGTGLGMTMVYKIIKEFSGDIHIESREGEGTAFAISLPVPQEKTCLLPYTKKPSIRQSPDAGKKAGASDFNTTERK